jgi:hypothetical protein
MSRAQQIVGALLEADPDEVNAKDYVNAVHKDSTGGTVNSISAMTANTFYHRRLKYKGCDARPLEARRNGRTKTWKTRPGQFRIPVKYGMYDYFYIDQDNAHEWATVPNPAKAE